MTATSQPSAWSTTTYPPTVLNATQAAASKAGAYAYDPLGHTTYNGLGLTSPTATPALAVAHQYDSRGWLARGVRLAIADLLIGVTALELGYRVATANVRHFQMVPGLEVVPL